MKSLIQILIVALSLGLAFSSCQKEEPDPCESLVCFNGGECKWGNCNCPPGFSGAQCQIADPCYNITCLNGGTCINGNCDCPPGYTGSNCGTMLTPVSMTITRVDLTDYPVTTPSGGGWDISDGADVFVTHNQGTASNANSYQSAYWQNVTGQDLVYSSTVPQNNLPYTLTNLSSYHVLGVWDYDSASNSDFMAGVYYTPANEISQFTGFPTSFVLSTGKITATIHVTWNF